VIRISVSQAAKLLGLTRKNVQCDIHKGILQTHEGLVTMDSLYRAYPNCCLDTTGDIEIDRVNDIKARASYQNSKGDNIKNENEKLLIGIIDELKSELTDVRNELIYWKSLYNSDIKNNGWSFNCKNIK
jgi:hypothetical protein